MSASTKNVSRFILALTVCILLTACGKTLDGTYADESGMTSFKFQSNGKVITSGLGIEKESDYKIDDKKIKINVGEGGDMVMTLQEDGTIEGPMGVKLVKKD